MNCLFSFLLKRCIPAVFLLSTLPGWASEHGGAASSAPPPMQFIVNVGNSVATMRVLQISIALEFAHAEVAQLLAAIRPKVQHRIILLLSGEEVASLQTVKGKQALQGRLLSELNDLINETSETGVSEVFFTNFIIQ
jgi:flagellar FliL protein